jgi:hypothetical protein
MKLFLSYENTRSVMQPLQNPPFCSSIDYSGDHSDGFGSFKDDPHSHKPLSFSIVHLKSPEREILDQGDKSYNND